MKRIALAVALSLAVGGSAFAAGRAPKHSAPLIQCQDSVADFLHDMAGNTKGLSVSQALTPKQYSLVKDLVKKYSVNHKDAPGDNAMVIDADGAFALILTKGSGDATKVCAIMAVPAEVVVGIVAAGEPTKEAASPPAKSDPDELHL